MTADVASIASIISVIVGIIIQIVVLSWFLSGVNSRLSTTERDLVELKADFKKTQAERSELNARLVRVETLLNELLAEVRRRFS